MKKKQIQQRIVVVDDQKKHLDVAKKSLEKAGAKVEAFDNPVEGLERVKKGDFDWLFTDLMFPSKMVSGEVKERYDKQVKDAKEFYSENKSYSNNLGCQALSHPDWNTEFMVPGFKSEHFDKLLGNGLHIGKSAGTVLFSAARNLGLESVIVSAMHRHSYHEIRGDPDFRQLILPLLIEFPDLVVPEESDFSNIGMNWFFLRPDFEKVRKGGGWSGLYKGVQEYSSKSPAVRAVEALSDEKPNLKAILSRCPDKEELFDELKKRGAFEKTGVLNVLPQILIEEMSGYVRESEERSKDLLNYAVGLRYRGDAQWELLERFSRKNSSLTGLSDEAILKIIELGEHSGQSTSDLMKFYNALTPERKKKELISLAQACLASAERGLNWLNASEHSLSSLKEAEQLFREAGVQPPRSLDSLEKRLRETIEDFEIPRGIVERIEQEHKSLDENAETFVSSDDRTAVAYQKSKSDWPGFGGISYYEGTSVANQDKELVVKNLSKWRDGQDSHFDRPGDSYSITGFTREEDGTYFLTLESRTGKQEIIEIDFENSRVEVNKYTDIGKLRKQKELIKILDGLKGKSLEESCNGFGDILVKKGKEINRAGPKIIRTTVDKKRNLAAIAVGYYTSGCGPALREVDFYVLKRGEDGELLYQNLGSENLNTGSNSSWSTTGLRTDEFELLKDKVRLKGSVYENTCNEMTSSWSSKKLGDISAERTLRGDYSDVRGFIED